MAKRNSAPPEIQQKVYIGPSIPSSGLRNAMILRGTDEEIQNHISGIAEQYPEIGYLLVDVNGLPEAQKRVRTKGNILNKYYMDMAAKASHDRKRGGDYA